MGGSCALGGDYPKATTHPFSKLMFCFFLKLGVLLLETLHAAC